MQHRLGTAMPPSNPAPPGEPPGALINTSLPADNNPVAKLCPYHTQETYFLHHRGNALVKEIPQNKQCPLEASDRNTQASQGLRLFPGLLTHL